MKIFIKKFCLIFSNCPKLLPFALSLIFLHCGDFQNEIREARALEIQNRKAEALYIYENIIARAPDNSIANKRLGNILSENTASLSSAIYHLEKGQEADPDNETLIKLFDLYIVTNDYKKAALTAAAAKNENIRQKLAHYQQCITARSRVSWKFVSESEMDENLKNSRKICLKIHSN